MTSNSPQPPDLDRAEKSIKALTDLTSGLTGLLRLVAGMIRKRQWVDLLMFASAVSIIFIGTKFTHNCENLGILLVIQHQPTN
jgi:hypothetical protein